LAVFAGAILVVARLRMRERCIGLVVDTWDNPEGGLVKETDAAKLTAIVSLGTAVIGAGAALLPTGAAAGAAARILSRDVNPPSGGG
jgi:hypothetical protein